MIRDNYVILIFTGAERYSTYTGYADTFEFAGDFNDETARYASHWYMTLWLCTVCL